LKSSKGREKVYTKFEKKAGKSRHKFFEKLSQIFKKAGKSHILSACLCILAHAVAGFRVLVLAFAYLFIVNRERKKHYYLIFITSYTTKKIIIGGIAATRVMKKIDPKSNKS
jgi:succinate dehydrogenase/fumarate reductase cytochrome b subunit